MAKKRWIVMAAIAAVIGWLLGKKQPEVPPEGTWRDIGKRTS